MNTYRVTHDLAHVPDAVHALSKLVVLKDPETSGAFVGFLAGVLAANPDRAEQIVGKMFSLPPEDQWIIVQAIAYSGLPGWKALMQKFSDRMPTRRLMIEKYLAGKLPTLQQAGFEKPPANSRRWATICGSISPASTTTRGSCSSRARRCSISCGATIARPAASIRRSRAHHRADDLG